MPVNRNALIRYKTIDTCLRNRFRKWTLDDLVDACSDALYEYEGIDKGVSKRSVQMDLQLMRSDKLGYNAPIVVIDKKYYTYDDPDYSITNIPLTDQDLGKLTEVVEILKQFKGFNHFQDLNGMVQRLENKIHSSKTNTEPVIDFEKNENLKGLEHIETLYQAIVRKEAVTLCYQSFKARAPGNFPFHPYYLKEYRNRWFVLGVRKKKEPLLTLALDRIITITESTASYIPKEKGFSLTEYLSDIVGVSVNFGGKVQEIKIFADHETAPYIRTKPIHHSQQEIEVLPHGSIFSLRVQVNFELEREILGFGDRIRVVQPETLKRRIKNCLENALDQYETEMSDGTLQGTAQKLAYKGSLLLNHVYTRKAINQIKSYIDHYLRSNQVEETHALRNVIALVPQLTPLIFNQNLINILGKINSGLFLTKAIFFDKSPDANWYVTWHQDLSISVKNKIDIEGFSGWTRKDGYYGVCPPDEILKDTVTVRIHLDDTDQSNGALKIVPGSHNKRLSGDEIKMITQNSIPAECNVPAGGVHIMKPLILHCSSKSIKQGHRRVLHLEFNSHPLPDSIEWAEKFEFRTSLK